MKNTEDIVRSNSQKAQIKNAQAYAQRMFDAAILVREQLALVEASLNAGEIDAAKARVVGALYLMNGIIEPSNPDATIDMESARAEIESRLRAIERARDHD